MSELKRKNNTLFGAAYFRTRERDAFEKRFYEAVRQSAIHQAELRTKDAEIERLTAALATAEAERDAAVRALELAVESGDVLMFGRAGNTMTSLGLQPGHGYFVSYQGDLPDLHPSFRDAWDIFHRHAKDHPIIIAPNNTQQPAAAPAVDAAPVDSYKPTLGVMRSRLEAIKISLSKSSPEMREIGLREIMYLLEDLVDVYAEQHKGDTR